MTEDEWLNEPDFAQLVRFIDNRLSDRKRRLLAVAFCRLVGNLFDHPDLLTAVETAERYADGAATAAELEAGRQRCRVIAVQENQAWSEVGENAWLRSESAWAASLAATATPPVSVEALSDRTVPVGIQFRIEGGINSVNDPIVWNTLMGDHVRSHRALVWDVAGNPFAPVEFRAEWRTGTAVALAAQMYESGDFSAMPILADALQDAGCDNDDVLNHCRNPGTHARGCWVVDLILGKS
jgi:hypothetical protein